MRQILIRNITLPVDVPVEGAAAEACRRLRPFVSVKEASLWRRSVDARRKQVRFVYTMRAEIPDDALTASLLKAADAVELQQELPQPVFGRTPLQGRPVIVGFGPAGMFCGLFLAQYGFRPVILERGDGVEKRSRAVERFFRSGELDPESNIQFGAGGAGTFSDGKLMTRIHDGICRWVLMQLCKLGAPAQILTDAKPHIGTDGLCRVVQEMEKKICALGGEVHYRAKAEEVGYTAQPSGARADYVGVCGDRIPCSDLILAIGHSARDTRDMLRRAGNLWVPKPFSVGLRIEHRREDMDRAVYGELAGHPLLPPAEYALSEHVGARTVYTFCMCPGGEVVAAASESGGVVVNGMSNHARDGQNDNAAVCVSVEAMPEDCGTAFQRTLEQAAYEAGGRNYDAPAETVGDFLAGKHGGFRSSARVQSTYRGGGHVRFCDVRSLFPAELGDTLAVGLRAFGRKLSGYDAPDALLTGVETRTSSPNRMPRREDYTAEGCCNVYPCGEGAGYAGGITSAAVDGVRCALAIMKKYRRPSEGEASD